MNVFLNSCLRSNFMLRHLERFILNWFGWASKRIPCVVISNSYTLRVWIVSVKFMGHCTIKTKSDVLCTYKSIGRQNSACNWTPKSQAHLLLKMWTRNYNQNVLTYVFEHTFKRLLLESQEVTPQQTFLITVNVFELNQRVVTSEQKTKALEVNCKRYKQLYLLVEAGKQKTFAHCNCLDTDQVLCVWFLATCQRSNLIRH